MRDQGLGFKEFLEMCGPLGAPGICRDYEGIMGS